MQSIWVPVRRGSAIVPAAIKIAPPEIRVDDVGVGKIRVDDIGVSRIRVDEIGVDRIGVGEIKVDEIGVSDCRRENTCMVSSRMHGGALGVETIGIIPASMLTTVSTIPTNAL
jgi:hypothetical protein